MRVKLCPSFHKSMLAILVLGAALSAPIASAEQERVNLEDPNLAFSESYVTDTATSCPKTLSVKLMRQCLIKNGVATAEATDTGLETRTLTDAVQGDSAKSSRLSKPSIR